MFFISDALAQTAPAAPGGEGSWTSIIFMVLIFAVFFILLTTYTMVRERTREIGILKSLGPGRSFLIQQAMGEALSITRGRTQDLLPYLASLGVLYLNVMFYFLLALMFSAASNSRGAAIGIPMAVLFSYQFIVGLAPWTLEIMPWGLTNPGSGGSGNPAAAAIVLGQSYSVLPIIATLAWCVLFVVIGVWKFNRDEF